MLLTFIHAGFFLQFSDIMDKISDYIGKQRKNSDGECDIHIPRFYSAFISKMVKDCLYEAIFVFS